MVVVDTDEFDSRKAGFEPLPPRYTTGVLAKYHPGDRVSVTWMDTSGQRHTSSVTLTTGPAK